MLVWIKSIFQALGGLFQFLVNKQLIDAGKAMERADVDKAQREADKISQAEIAVAETIRNNNDAGDEFLLPPDQR
jgi:hypothetical protein